MTWHIDRRFLVADNEYGIRDADEKYIGRFTASVDTEDCGKAHANLIAAAPELLEALQAIKRAFGNCGATPFEQLACGLMDAAIFKATGAA